MWGGFVIRKNYIYDRKNFGRQKIKLIKSWILKTVYGKHLLIFSDFFKNQVVLQKLFHCRIKLLGFSVLESRPALSLSKKTPNSKTKKEL